MAQGTNVPPLLSAAAASATSHASAHAAATVTGMVQPGSFDSPSQTTAGAPTTTNMSASSVVPPPRAKEFWDKISTRTGRSYEEVRLHAYKYFIKLHTLVKDPSILAPAPSSVTWDDEEDRMFERLLAENPTLEAQRWEKIAEKLPNKTADDVRKHFELLLSDVVKIECGITT